MAGVDVFVLVTGTVSVLALVPLLYLALRSMREATSIREIQREVAGLLRESKELGENLHVLQREIQSDQQHTRSGIDNTRQAVERVTEGVEQVSSVIERASRAQAA